MRWPPMNSYSFVVANTEVFNENGLLVGTTTDASSKRRADSELLD